MSLEQNEGCNHDKEHEMREEPLVTLAWSYASVHPHCWISTCRGCGNLTWMRLGFPSDAALQYHWKHLQKESREIPLQLSIWL